MTPSLSGRPAISFAMLPSRTQHVLPEALIQRLDSIGRVLDAAPMQSFDDSRAAKLLAETEILITGWGRRRSMVPRSHGRRISSWWFMPQAR